MWRQLIKHHSVSQPIERRRWPLIYNRHQVKRWNRNTQEVLDIQYFVPVLEDSMMVEIDGKLEDIGDTRAIMLLQ